MTWLLIVIMTRGGAAGVSMHMERFSTEEGCIVAMFGTAAVASKSDSVVVRSDCFRIQEPSA